MTILVYQMIYGANLYVIEVSDLCYHDRLEIETYKSLDPGIRVVILKAICDIRVEVL